MSSLKFLHVYYYSYSSKVLSNIICVVVFFIVYGDNLNIIVLRKWLYCVATSEITSDYYKLQFLHRLFRFFCFVLFCLPVLLGREGLPLLYSVSYQIDCLPANTFPKDGAMNVSDSFTMFKPSVSPSVE